MDTWHDMLELGHVLLHLPFLVQTAPVVSLIPCPFCDEHNDTPFMLPSGPAFPLYAAYLRRDRFIEKHKVCGGYVQAFLCNRCRYKGVVFPCLETINDIYLLLLSESLVLVLGCLTYKAHRPYVVHSSK